MIENIWDLVGSYVHQTTHSIIVFIYMEGVILVQTYNCKILRQLCLWIFYDNLFKKCCELKHTDFFSD